MKTEQPSYHVFTLSVGKDSVERVYITEDAGGREEAERTLKRSQRKRILSHRIARPTSFYKNLAEIQGMAFPMPPARRIRRRAA